MDEQGRKATLEDRLIPAVTRSAGDQKAVLCQLTASLSPKLREACAADQKEFKPFLPLGGAEMLLGAPGVPPAAAPAVTGVSWEVAAIQGFANFLTDRAKSELRDWVVQSALSDLCVDPGAQYLPKTCALSQQYAYGLPGIETLMVRGFRDDLKVLPAFLIWKNGAPPASQDWGYVLTNYYDALRRGHPAVYLVAGLAQTPAIKSGCADSNQAGSVNCRLYWAGVLTQAYLWAVEDPSKNFTARRFVAALYLALYEQEDTGTLSALTKKLKPVVVDRPNEFARIVRGMSGTFDNVRILLAEIKAETEQLKKLQQDSAKLREQLLSAARLSELSAQAMVQMAKTLAALEIESRMPDLKGIEQIARAAGQMAAGRYSEAFAEVTVLLRCLEPDRAASLLDCTGWQPASCGSGSEAERGSCAGRKRYLATLSRHLPLVVGLAEANSAADIQNVLDTTASPVGAWKFKRERKMTSVGALVGAHYSSECLSGAGIESYTGSAAGLFAPVGLDFSWPSGDRKTASGIFLSVLDFGNLLSTRLSGKQTDQVADTDDDVSFSDIRSFGVYFHRGFRNSPVVWGIGAAYTPALRSAELAGGGERDVDSVRVSAFVAIDITLFPF